MFDRKWLKSTNVKTGVRVIKSRPAEMVDIEFAMGILSIDLVENATKIELCPEDAFELAMAIIGCLPETAEATAIARLTASK